MGWTTYLSKRKSNGKRDIRGTIDDLIAKNSDDDVKVKVLKSVVKGNVYYGAIQTTDQEEELSTSALVVLTSVDEDFYYDLAIKPIDEECGPFNVECPDSILDLLSPTTSESALEWRKKCRKYNEKERERNRKIRKLNKLPLGTKIGVYDSKKEHPFCALAQ